MSFVMTTTGRPLYLGFEYSLQAAHPGAGADAFSAAALFNPASLLAAALAAEAAAVDFLLLADTLDSDGTHPASFEPMTLAAYIASHTRRLGLVVSADPNFAQPFNLARLVASIDHISHGRAGWNVLSGASGDARRNHQGVAATLDENVPEYLDVVRKLWDSWEGDAFLRDKASGVFVRPEKIHAVEHRGPTLAVQGPLNVARSPQGQTPVFGYQSPALAGALAAIDVLRSDAQSAAPALALREQLDRQRWPGKVFGDVAVLLASDDHGAWQRLAELDAQLPVDLAALSAQLGTALPYSADQPLAAHQAAALNASGQALLHSARQRQAQRREALGLAASGEQPSARQLLQARHLPGRLAIGSAQSVARQLLQWAGDSGFDGLTLRPVERPGQLQLFSTQLVAALVASGELTPQPPAALLQTRLGLQPRANRYASTPEKADA